MTCFLLNAVIYGSMWLWAEPKTTGAHRLVLKCDMKPQIRVSGAACLSRWRVCFFTTGGLHVFRLSKLVPVKAAFQDRLKGNDLNSSQKKRRVRVWTDLRVNCDWTGQRRQTSMRWGFYWRFLLSFISSRACRWQSCPYQPVKATTHNVCSPDSQKPA